MKDRSVCLIDAQFLENARQGIVSDQNWNLHNFVERLVPKHHWRFRTYYFEALPYKHATSPTATENSRYAQREAELKQIERLERFTVRRGYCKLEVKRGRPLNGGATQPFERISQKMVDVLLATELTRIAWSQESRHIGLVAGDADFWPAVAAAKSAGAVVRLFHIRRPRTGTADRLIDLADERVDFLPILEAMQRGDPIPTK